MTSSQSVFKKKKPEQIENEKSGFSLTFQNLSVPAYLIF